MFYTERGALQGAVPDLTEALSNNQHEPTTTVLLLNSFASNAQTDEHTNPHAILPPTVNRLCLPTNAQL